MIRQKTSIERQFDLKLYQFMIPSDGNWNEVAAFAQDILKYANDQIEAAKKLEEEKKLQEQPKEV
jgi:hypothetical protein